VRREGTLFVPESRATSCFAGDQVYVMTDSQDVDRTLEIFGKEVKTRRSGW
jgi:trk system potassium uptake protein TrkA